MKCTTAGNKTKNGKPTWRAMNFLRLCFSLWKNEFNSSV